MSKILGSWSAMRKYLEKEMLCDSLQGRIRYEHKKYRNMDSCWGIFEIFADDKLLKRFSAETMGKSFQNEDGLWKAYWAAKNISVTERTAFDDEDFADALADYRSLQICDALKSENPLVRMFAVLDRRIGKRTLVELHKTIEEQPEWLRQFYLLRLHSENIC